MRSVRAPPMRSVGDRRQAEQWKGRYPPEPLRQSLDGGERRSCGSRICQDLSAFVPNHSADLEHGRRNWRVTSGVAERKSIRQTPRLEHQINPPAEFMRDQVANQARPKPGLFRCGVWSAKFTPNDGEVIAVPSATGFCHVTDTRRHQSIMRRILPHWYDDDNFSAFKSH